MNISFGRLSLLVVMLFFSIYISGCSSDSDGEQTVTLEQKIYNEYLKNNRVEQYNEIKERYDDIKVILLINEKEDAWWITNFTLYIAFSILPDLPQALAGGGIIAVIYGTAWWLGVVLTGGGILAVLAFVGGMLGVVPGIPPAIMGIIYLGVMFSMLSNIFSNF